MKIKKKNLKVFSDDRGLLAPLEFKDIDFDPKRMFYVTNIPEGERRGEHAHYETKQLLICVKGKIGVSLTDKAGEEYLVLNENECVYVSNLVWDAQDFLTGHDVLLVLCSTNYNEKDYINDKEDFLKGLEK